MTEPPQVLIGMQDRVGAVGGELEVLSVAGAGTTVRGTVPLDASEPPIGRREDAP